MLFLIITVFVAEIIIATSLLSWIMKADKCVLEINDKVTSKRLELKFQIMDFRAALKDLFDAVQESLKFLMKKREEYIYKTVKSVGFVLLMLVLHDKKWKKPMIVLQLADLVSEIYEGFQTVRG